MDITQLLLTIIVPTIIAGIPATISAIAAARSSSRAVKLQEQNRRLEEEKLELAKKTTSGDVSEKIATSYDKLIINMREQIDRLEKERDENTRRIDECLSRIGILEDGVRKLTAQVKTLSPDAVPAFSIRASTP